MRADPAILIAAAAVTAALTPLVRRLACAAGFLDRPSARKAHEKAIPLLGGLAVVAGIAAGLSAALLFARGLPEPALPSRSLMHVLPALAFGLALAFVVGLVDDRHGMRPLVKLAFQVACGVPLVAAGGGLSSGGAPFFGALVSLLWIATVMNAANFLDNMDGVLSSVAGIAGLGLALLAGSAGEPAARAFALALAGAAGGFLLFNFPPARIFLGDAGSLPIGFALAASSLLAARGADVTAVERWIPPALVLGYLAFDITLVTAVRLREGRKIYLGGTDHSSHRLRALLGSPRRALAGVAALAASCAALGYVSSEMTARGSALALAVAAAVFGALGVTLVRVTASQPARVPRGDG